MFRLKNLSLIKRQTERGLTDMLSQIFEKKAEKKPVVGTTGWEKAF
jgi:hypothetical protein